MSKRKAAEELILKFVKEVDKSGYNFQKYTELLKDMTDKDFDDYMKRMRDGEASLVIFTPIGKSTGITVENNLAIAKRYGIPMFEKLIFTGDPNVPDYKTDIEYMLLDLPIRRQSQNIVKKISVPDDNKTIDSLTFQPTGSSKGSKISYPELQVMIGMGLDHTANELIRFRGGDKGGFAAYNAMMFRHGSINLKTISAYTTGVESTKALKTFLLSMHLKYED